MQKELTEFMIFATEYIDYLRSFSEKSKGEWVYIERDIYKPEPSNPFISIWANSRHCFSVYCHIKKPLYDEGQTPLEVDKYFDPETADFRGFKQGFPSLDLDDFCKELWKLVNFTRVEETHNFFTGTKTYIYCSKSLYDSQLKKIEEAYQRVINGNEKKEKETNYNKGSEDKYDQLFKLKKLLDDGAISKEEYNIEKKKILD